MAMKQEPKGMSMDMGNVIYWLENQIALTYRSKLDSAAGPTRIIESLQLNRLNKFLNTSPGHYNLRSFNEADVPGPRPSDEDDQQSHASDREQESGEPLVKKGIDLLGKAVEAVGEGLETVGERIEDLGKVMQGRDTSDEDDDNGDGHSLNSPVGKYLLNLPPGQGTIVIGFFHVEKLSQPIQQDSASDVVKLLNSSPDKFNTPDATFVASMPNWLNGGTTNGGPLSSISHGCPVMPPIQVGDSCNRWKLKLPEQFSLPQDGTGVGVTVFVLDTLPKPEDITSAASNPGSNNSLLASMAQNMVIVASDGTVSPPGATSATPPAIKVNYTLLPDVLDIPSPDQPATGKDIYDRLVGFPMVDHGLFVAGVIRDLTPDANIECIRVLNDYGVGNTTVLTNALTDIYNRLGPGGDLNGQQVVINMSLVTTPANEELEQFGFTLQTIMPAREGLLIPLELLAAQGVVFVASAGNDSDPNNPMNPDGFRWGSRFPAAFAYPGVRDTGLSEMIPIGAVDSQGIAADYSNYPGTNGIATYGGKRPQPDPPNPGGTVTRIIGDIDAPRGVYSSVLYPALAKEDTEPFHSTPPFSYPEYQRNGSSTWAFWAGTSFATPVISALAARILQTRQSTDPSVRDIIVNTAMQQQEQSTTDWTRLESSYETASGPMILVTQECQSDNAPIQ